MSPWKGRMKTSHLNDRQIRPREYRTWADARRLFTTHTEHRKGVEDWKKAITKRNGLREPILIGRSARYPEDLYIGDGHHRAIALMELGIRDFPFHWYWIRSFGVHMEREPFPYRDLRL